MSYIVYNDTYTMIDKNIRYMIDKKYTIHIRELYKYSIHKFICTRMILYRVFPVAEIT